MPADSVILELGLVVKDFLKFTVMLVPYNLTYFVSTLLTFVPWVIIYILRKDQRKEMLTLSLIGGFVGLVTEYFFWTSDWWRPQTITGTVIGPEDYLLGFSNFGLAGVIYEFIFNKTNYKKYKKVNRKKIILLMLMQPLIFCCLYYLGGLTSFYSYIITCTEWFLLLAVTRKDLIISAILSAVILMFLFVPIYLFMQLISPGCIEKTWLFANLTGISIIGIPLEDFGFYFFLGLFLGPVYELWYGESFRKKTS